MWRHIVVSYNLVKSYDVFCFCREFTQQQVDEFQKFERSARGDSRQILKIVALREPTGHLCSAARPRHSSVAGPPRKNVNIASLFESSSVESVISAQENDSKDSGFDGDTSHTAMQVLESEPASADPDGDLLDAIDIFTASNSNAGFDDRHEDLAVSLFEPIRDSLPMRFHRLICCDRFVSTMIQLPICPTIEPHRLLSKLFLFSTILYVSHTYDLHRSFSMMQCPYCVVFANPCSYPCPPFLY